MENICGIFIKIRINMIEKNYTSNGASPKSRFCENVLEESVDGNMNHENRIYLV